MLIFKRPLMIILVIAMFLVSMPQYQTAHSAKSLQPQTSTSNQEIPVDRITEIALTSILAQSDIAKEELQLVGKEEITFHNLNQTYIAVTMIHDTPDNFQSFTVLVNPETGETKSLNELQIVDAEARQKMYGKLHPELHDLLQKSADDDRFPIAIWATQVGALPALHGTRHLPSIDVHWFFYIPIHYIGIICPSYTGFAEAL